MTTHTPDSERTTDDRKRLSALALAAIEWAITEPPGLTDQLARCERAVSSQERSDVVRAVGGLLAMVDDDA